MKSLKYLCISIISIGLFASCQVNIFSYSDLRPSTYEYPNNIAKGKQLLERMGEAHRNHLWDSIHTYQVDFEEESFGFFGKKSSPFQELAMEFNLNYIPRSSTGYMEIISGIEQGDIWGIQDGRTYQKEGDISMLKENDPYKFSLENFQYFIEFPNRIIEGEIVDFIGTKLINGHTADGVIVSWRSVEPQKEFDQFVIWLDQETYLISEIEYTVREKFKFAQGTAEFTEYSEFNDFLLPATISSRSNIKKQGYLHVKKINDFTPDLRSVDDLTPLENNGF